MLLGGKKLLDRGKYSMNAKRFDVAAQISSFFFLAVSMHTSCHIFLLE